MEYPVFDVKYQAVYSSTIEFQTNVNEKMKGREQRYPIWTYPKRTFVLRFDKNFKERQKLEEFFMLVMGQAGKFRFVWDEEKGGNGQEYLCTFDSDSMQQNIKDLGYVDTELSICTIDDKPFEKVEKLDFYYEADSESSLDFHTLIDKVFTSQNNRKSWWDAPKRSWTLTFKKSARVRRKLENFFISKRGKFRGFNWVWEKERGGDGKTYHVRFDADTLESQISEFGYGEIQIKLKEVFPNVNADFEIEKDEIIPRKLLKIEIEGGSIYVLDNETLDVLNYNGESYLGAPLTHGEIVKDDNSSVSKLNIGLSNVALSISGIIAKRGDVITNAPAVLTLVFLDLNTNSILQSTKKILYAGRCNNLKLDYDNATMDIETELGGYEVQAPIMKYRTGCQVRRFKDCRCRYTGKETVCDRTFTRCKELGNHGNFRGFPQMFNELVIKV